MIAARSPVMERRGRSLAQLERDAALGRMSRARRWLIVGAAGLTAGFAALVSAISPGHKLGARPGSGVSLARGTRASAALAGATRMPPLASASDLGLQGPAQAPSSGSSSPAPQASAPQPPAPQTSAPPAPQASAPASQAPAPAPAPVSGGS